jgi:hypothetical protein
MKQRKSARMHSKHNSTKKSFPAHQCQNHSTHGLHKWYHHSITHFGSAILAKSHGIHEKVHAYKNSLHRLDCSLDDAIKHIHDPDTRRDLEILKRNLKAFIHASNKCL